MSLENNTLARLETDNVKESFADWNKGEIVEVYSYDPFQDSYVIKSLRTGETGRVMPHNLSPYKKKNELEIGDKFIPKTGNVYAVKVLAKAKFKDKMYYLCNVLGKDWIHVWSEDFVGKIIFDMEVSHDELWGRYR